MVKEQKWHINDKGEVGVCRAEKKPCQFGAHFDNQDEAQYFNDHKNEWETTTGKPYSKTEPKEFYDKGEWVLGHQRMSEKLDEIHKVILDDLSPMMWEDSLWFGAEEGKRMNGEPYNEFVSLESNMLTNYAEDQDAVEKYFQVKQWLDDNVETIVEDYFTEYAYHEGVKTDDRYYGIYKVLNIPHAELQKSVIDTMSDMMYKDGSDDTVGSYYANTECGFSIPREILTYDNFAADNDSWKYWGKQHQDRKMRKLARYAAIAQTLDGKDEWIGHREQFDSFEEATMEYKQEGEYEDTVPLHERGWDWPTDEELASDLDEYDFVDLEYLESKQ